MNADLRPILVTGFEPFGGDAVNPSWEAARALEGWRCQGRPVQARLLPVVYGQAWTVLEAAMAELEPALVLCLGLAAGIPHLALERVALNLDDARIPDNAGQQPLDLPVLAGAPTAYLTGLPVKAMAAALGAAGIPAALSHSAGTFVCNHVFFRLAHHLAASGPGCRGGFLHLPLLPAQAAALKGQPSMALETMVAGLKVALEAAAGAELRAVGGSLS